MSPPTGSLPFLLLSFTFTDAAATRLALSDPFSIIGEAMVVTAVWPGLTANSLPFYYSSVSPDGAALSV